MRSIAREHWRIRMSAKVLFVDDEPNVLQSIRRTLRKEFDLDTAEGGEEALSLLNANGTYAVIVSDMRMPGMNGVELLAQAKVETPDTVRMMLTGNADQQTAVDAVNHGDIFRFMNKPCETEELASAVRSGIRQHQLITAERELLEKTLRGSIKALADILSLTDPEVFGRTTRFKNRVKQLASVLSLADSWQFESAAMLSQIGCVTVSQEVVRQRANGETMSAAEMSEFAAHAAVGADLVMKIPRMEDIAQSIRYQEKNFDGSGFPKDGPTGDTIPLGARLLKVVIDLDAAESSGLDPTAALEKLKQHASCYDPAILAALEISLGQELALRSTTMDIRKLTDSMVLAEDVVTSDNVLLIAKGQEMTLSARRHLLNYLSRGLISEAVTVWLSPD